MSGALVHVVDVTDVLRHFLATKELSGIPRLLITIIESSAARDDVEFCIFDRREERFLLIGNRRSIDVDLLDQYELPTEGDNFEFWIEQFAPDLEPVAARLGKRQAHYCFLSSQWDTFPDRDGYALLGRFLKQERTTVLHHDSYLSDSLPDSDGARRFAGYWSTVAKSTARIIHISEHSKQFSTIDSALAFAASWLATILRFAIRGSPRACRGTRSIWSKETAPISLSFP